jgi:hypothetical protein
LSESWANDPDSFQYGAVFFTHDSLSNLSSSFLPYSATVNIQCNMEEFENYTNHERCEDYGGIGYVVQYNFTALHVSPLLQVITDEAIVREALNQSSFSINITIDPLPITYTEDAYGQSEDAFLPWFLGKQIIPPVMDV